MGGRRAPDWALRVPAVTEPANEGVMAAARSVAGVATGGSGRRSSGRLRARLGAVGIPREGRAGEAPNARA